MKTSCVHTMSLRGAPRTLGAQEYTRQLKNRVVSKSIDSSPQPAHRRYNYVPISVLGNRANQVVKLVSDPTKSCSGGWTDESGCCYSSPMFNSLLDFGGQTLPPYDDFSSSIYACGNTVCGECPGPCQNLSFPVPTSQFNFRVANVSGIENAIGMIFLNFIDFPALDFAGGSATVDGVPVSFFGGTGNPVFAILFPSPGTLTSSSQVAINLPVPINYLDAVGLSNSP